ncbi:MAG: hypothetical protein V2A73_16675 [Pseudomonadota bacterium]
MQYFKTPQPGQVIRTSAEDAEIARYHAKCAEDAWQQRQAVEQHGRESRTRTADTAQPAT